MVPGKKVIRLASTPGRLALALFSGLWLAACDGQGGSKDIEVPAGQANAEIESTSALSESEIMQATGLSKEELDAGRAYLNGWDGSADEIPPFVKFSLKGPSAGEAKNQATYNGAIQAILARSCTSCHSANGERKESPMTTYAEVKARAADIVKRVKDGTMPPGGGLAQADRDLLDAWQRDGFKE